jgi:hypothetical protein
MRDGGGVSSLVLPLIYVRLLLHPPLPSPLPTRWSSPLPPSVPSFAPFTCALVCCYMLSLSTPRSPPPPPSFALTCTVVRAVVYPSCALVRAVVRFRTAPSHARWSLFVLLGLTRARRPSFVCVGDVAVTSGGMSVLVVAGDVAVTAARWWWWWWW